MNIIGSVVKVCLPQVCSQTVVDKMELYAIFIQVRSLASYMYILLFFLYVVDSVPELVSIRPDFNQRFKIGICFFSAQQNRCTNW